MATPGRKYSDEQIRFVLTRWDTDTRAEIVVQYCEEYGKEPKDFTEKHAKYIKDAYAGKPRFLQEFGHLRSDRQLQNAFLKEQARQNPSVLVSQGNVSVENAQAASTPPNINDTQTATPSTLDGVTGNGDSTAETINVIGLLPFSTPASGSILQSQTPIPLPPLPRIPSAQVVNPLPSSSTPEVSVNASLPSGTLGAPRVVGTTMPPQNNASTVAVSGYQNSSPGFSGQPNTGSGIPQASRVQDVHSGAKQGHGGNTAGQQSAGMTTSNHFMLPSLPSVSNQSRSIATPRSLAQPAASPRVLSPAQIDQSKVNPLPNVATPPSHIQLPTGDFGIDGVWYNASHDGCSIPGRHRHNNDGTILLAASKTPTHGVQSTKRNIESISRSISPEKSSLETRPKDSIHVATQPRTVAHSTTLQPPTANSRAEVVGPKVSTQPEQSGYNVPTHGAMSMLPVPSLQQHQGQQTRQVQFTPAQAQQLSNQHVSKPKQLGSPFQPQSTIVVQPAKGLSVPNPPVLPSSYRTQQPHLRNVNQPGQPDSLFPFRDTATFQPIKERSVTITPGSSMPDPARRSPNQRVNQPVPLGSPFRYMDTTVAQPATEPNLTIPPNLSTVAPAPAPTTTTVPHGFLPWINAESSTPAWSVEPDTLAIANTDYDTFERLPDTVDGLHFQDHLYNTFAEFPWTEPFGLDDAPMVRFSPSDHDTDFPYVYNITEANNESNGMEDSYEGRVTDVAANNLTHPAHQQAATADEAEPPAKKIKR